MYKLKNATKDNIDKIIFYISKMIGDLNSSEIAKIEAEKYLNNENYKIVFPIIDNEISGICIIKFDPFEGGDLLSEIIFFLIDEKNRKMGIGSKILMEIEKELIKNKIRKNYIKTNTANIGAICFWINNMYRFEAKLENLSLKTDYYLLSKHF